MFECIESNETNRNINATKQCTRKAGADHTQANNEHMTPEWCNYTILNNAGERMH